MRKVKYYHGAKLTTFSGHVIPNSQWWQKRLVEKIPEIAGRKYLLISDAQFGDSDWTLGTLLEDEIMTHRDDLIIAVTRVPCDVMDIDHWGEIHERIKWFFQEQMFIDVNCEMCAVPSLITMIYSGNYLGQEVIEKLKLQSKK